MYVLLQNGEDILPNDLIVDLNNKVLITAGSYVQLDIVSDTSMPVLRKISEQGEAVQTSHNSDYEAALWSELSSLHTASGVDFKDEWVAVTKERLNIALKNAQHCS